MYPVYKGMLDPIIKAGNLNFFDALDHQFPTFFDLSPTHALYKKMVPAHSSLLLHSMGCKFLRQSWAKLWAISVHIACKIKAI